MIHHRRGILGRDQMLKVHTVARRVKILRIPSHFLLPVLPVNSVPREHPVDKVLAVKKQETMRHARRCSDSGFGIGRTVWWGCGGPTITRRDPGGP